MSAIPDVEALAAEALPECPYQGLEPFSENDRNYFFGRDADKERIGANLVTSPLTIFYGASGVGKTSVLLAGVLPFVRRQPDMTAIVFRSWQSPEFEQELKSELAKAVAEKSETPLDVDQTLDRCLEDAARLTGGTIAVAFDQFEEYILYHAPSSPQGRSFDTAFARAVNRSEADVNFLIGIREDALARLDRFRQYIPDLLSNRQQLAHLDETGGEQAIRKPLEHYNDVVRAKVLPGLAMAIEDDLVIELIRQVRIGGGVGFGGTGGVTGAVRVETPFMQMVLQKLWNAERKAGSPIMREKTLHDLGDAKKIVLDHVDDVMKSLTDGQRAAAAAIFDRLVTPSGSKIAYLLSDLVEFAGARGGDVESLIGRLSDRHARILREVAPAGESPAVRYEIFHDVLSYAVLAWRAKHLHNMQEARARDRRMVIAIVAAALVGTVFVGGWIFEWKRDAAAAAETARLRERERLKAEALNYQAQLAEAGANSNNVANLTKALAIYTKLGDQSGQRRVLEQIGSLSLTAEDYHAALDAYQRALQLPGTDAANAHVRARRLLAEAGKHAKAGEYADAATSYQDAARLFAQAGFPDEQAQALTSAAIANQNLNQIGNAEHLWKEALQIQTARKDFAAQAKTLAGIQSLDKQRKIVVRPPATTDQGNAAGPCTVKSMNGYWLQVDNTNASSATSFIWKLNVTDSTEHPLLHAARVDGTVSGNFVRSENWFSGTLEWLDGTSNYAVRIGQPSDKSNCNRLETNQSFSFVRTKYAE